MSGPQQSERAWKRRLPMLLLALTVPVLTTSPAAKADPPAQYAVNGNGGAALWGFSSQAGTQLLAFAFTQATPLGNTASFQPAGPRLALTVSQWAFGSNGWVQRQWSADVAIDASALTINADLSQGILDTTLTGTLVEQSFAGTVVHRNVPGRVQVNWTAITGTANSTLSYIYQTPTFGATVQTNGPGRFATANATVTVEALGAPITAWGFGTLFSANSGLLSVTLG